MAWARGTLGHVARMACACVVLATRADGGATGGVVPMAVWCQWRCGANGGVVPMAVWCQWRCGANGGVVPTRDADGVWQHVEATTMWRRPAEAAGWHGAGLIMQRIWWERVLGCVRACGAWRVRSKPAVRCGAARSSSGGCGACGSGGGACSRCCPVRVHMIPCVVAWWRSLHAEPLHAESRCAVHGSARCIAVRGASRCAVHRGARCMAVRGASRCAVHGSARCIAVRGAWQCAVHGSARCMAVRGAWRCAGCVAI
jgi:hypothetical protein